MVSTLFRVVSMLGTRTDARVDVSTLTNEKTDGTLHAEVAHANSGATTIHVLMPE